MTKKLVEKLAEQAGFDYALDAYHINRFAELMINECANACSDPMCGREYSAKDLIKFWFEFEQFLG